jgi:hypothetical protein
LSEPQLLQLLLIILSLGPLRIYRVPNTGVSFLNSGAFLKPILQRSQCWCVDHEAKFVLRVREGSYYRIELSAATAEQKQAVEDLKKTLESLLRYEKTPSPFKKGFIDLPERPLTPVRQKIHTPAIKAKKWRLNKIWEPEDADRRAEFEAKNRSISERILKLSPRRHSELGLGPRRTAETKPAQVEEAIPDNASGTDLSSDHSETPSDPVLDRDPILDLLGLPQPGQDSMSDVSTDDSMHPSLEDTGPLESDIFPADMPPAEGQDSEPGRDPPPADDAIGLKIPDLEQHHSPSISPIDSPMQAVRSLTPPSQLLVAPALSTMDDSDARSMTSSRDSFYSVAESLPSDHIEQADASSRDHEAAHVKRLGYHTRNHSEVTAVPDTPRALRIPPPDPRPTTPTLLSDTSSTSENVTWEDAAVTPPQTLRLRRPKEHLAVQHRSEPDHIPQTLSILSPTIGAGGKPISTALIHKTYSLLLGPPAHLIALMLQIAARIVNRFPQHRGKIPGSWESDTGEEEDEWDDDEDDFGIPLGNNRSTRSSSMASAVERPSPAIESEDGWEID